MVLVVEGIATMADHPAGAAAFAQILFTPQLESICLMLRGHNFSCKPIKPIIHILRVDVNIYMYIYIYIYNSKNN